MTKRVAIYVRVSTNDQTCENQRRELTAWAERSGHQVVQVFEDAGISGAKGRDKRPAFDRMLKAAARREFDLLAVWSSDRLGRSLQHLIDVLGTIRDAGRGLYIHTQALDTTTPAGRAMFGMLAVFGEFEREMICERVNAGMARAKAHGTKTGRAIGRPRAAAGDEQIRAMLAAGSGIHATRRALSVGTGRVTRVAKAMRG